MYSTISKITQLFCLLLDYTDRNTKVPNIHDVVYDEMKTLIMDNQAVLE